MRPIIRFVFVVSFLSFAFYLFSIPCLLLKAHSGLNMNENLHY